MAGRGKRILTAKKNVEPAKRYTLKEAAEMIVAMPHAKFDETVDVAVRLGVNPAHAENPLKAPAGAFNFPLMRDNSGHMRQLVENCFGVSDRGGFGHPLAPAARHTRPIFLVVWGCPRLRGLSKGAWLW